MENIEAIEKFSNIIFERVTNGNVEYMDAIVSYCEELNIEVESITELISPSLIVKLEDEALANRVLKPSTTRRFDM